MGVVVVVLEWVVVVVWVVRVIVEVGIKGLQMPKLLKIKVPS